MAFVDVLIEETLPQLEIILPDGAVEKFGLEQAFPEQGTPILPFGALGAGAKNLLYTWKAVYNYVQDAFTPAPEPAQLQLGNVIKAFQAPIEAQIQLMASVTNILQRFLQNAGDRAYANDARLAEGLKVATATQVHFNQFLAQWLATIDGTEIPDLQTKVAAMPATLLKLALAIIPVVETWTVDHVFLPLAQQQAKDRVHTQTQLNKITGTDLPDLERRLLAKLAPVAVTATAAAAAAAKVAAWVDDCGEPMCQVQGPKTDLGKFLKGLKFAATAALLAEVASWTEADVENLIRQFVGAGTTAADDIRALFIDGGKSIGATIADIGL